MSLFLSIFLIISNFFSTFPSDAKAAIDFIEHHPEIKNQLTKTMTEEESVMALAIVAPEISQYSTIVNWAQQQSLSISYILFGHGNFSIGYFQMKPSFAEAIELIVSKNETLRRQHPQLALASPNATDEMSLRAQRNARLERLSSLEWQCIYLAAFISIAKKITENISFESDLVRLRYWATLYNAGVYLSENQVNTRLKQKQFPHFGTPKFNYAEVAFEFYQHLTGR